MSISKKILLGLLITLVLLAISAAPTGALTKEPPMSNTKVVNIQQSTVLYLMLMRLPKTTDSISVSCGNGFGKSVTFGLIVEDDWFTNIEKVYTYCGKNFSSSYTIYLTFK